uniref:Uncharacterized protein n=1 Tax=Meloidogyne enterolobii TaxID=390850 RepID=A0A6V7TZT7_MELEN|nr:unnamed protein product [Meloidogyne enterolobii]
MNKLLLVLLITFVIATIAIQYGMAQDEEEFHARLKRQWGWGGWGGRPWGWGGGWRRPWGWGGWGGGWRRPWGWGGGWGRR